MRGDRPKTWGRAQRALHWITAALIACGFIVAWVMVAVPFADLLEKFVLFQLHKTIGLTVLLLVLVRLALRFRRGRPAPEWDLSPARRHAASVMHAALYVLLLLTPVLGYFVAATSPIRIPTLFFGIIDVPHIVGASRFWFALLVQVHRAAAILLVVLAAGHAAAALENHFRGRSTLVRMWRG